METRRAVLALGASGGLDLVMAEATIKGSPSAAAGARIFQQKKRTEHELHESTREDGKAPLR